VKKFLSLLLTLACLAPILAQTTYKTHNIQAKKSHNFNPKDVKASYNPILINHEAPSPDGDSYRSFLLQQKIKSRAQFPIKKAEVQPVKNKTTAQPLIGKGLSMYGYFPTGRKYDVSGGIPNDNALAVSNNGILLSGINSRIWAYDINNDTTLFQKHTLNLAAIGFGSPTDRYYDPKMIYDEAADRFILVFLRDSDPATSAFMLCFSSTNNPTDPWYVYEIDGNPLNNNRWTDFPAVSITDTEVFLTGNLIIPGVSWQVGFDGSVIWQISKQDGYDNKATLQTKLFSDIKYEGKFTRNVHAVRGTGSIAPRQFFLSNRNFDITNDSIFVMEVKGTLDNSTLDIQVAKTTPNYGVPPNGRQQDTDLSDPTKGLQTNDARVLGAITNGDWIQYVSTTVNPVTGLAAIYHGTILNPTEANQTISGSIISHPTKDYGYPNIAFTGNEDCDTETLIGFNFTSPTDFPGVAAVYYDNNGNYSDVVTLKDGDNYTDRHSDSYERWGDYFAIQPKYNEPGKVWMGGYYGMLNNNNGTWLNELSSTDSNQLAISTQEMGDLVFCNGSFEVTPSGGLPPYQYSFNGAPMADANILDSICDGDTVNVTVMDQRGCMVSDVFATQKVAVGITATYPNPFTDHLVAQFSINRDQQVQALVFDLSGNLVDEILSTNAKAGLNELQFDMAPLGQGIYVLKVIGANEEEILVSKVFKKN
jgi:hypothetical protein